MTTAHRPTFHAAVGGKEQGGGRYIAGVSRTHVHDLASQMSLKVRATGQGTAAELTSDKQQLRSMLEERELGHLRAIGKAPMLQAHAALPPPPPPEDEDDDEDEPAFVIDKGDADDGGASKLGAAAAADTAADEDSEDSDDDDDEDEEAGLMRELERIKKERAQEAANKEREATEEAAAEQDSSILQGNPLIDPTRLGAAGGGSHVVKRRWDDDVVFKNQSREPKKEARRFINDTVRNDFHKRFLNKYVK